MTDRFSASDYQFRSEESEVLYVATDSIYTGICVTTCRRSKS